MLLQGRPRNPATHHARQRGLQHTAPVAWPVEVDIDWARPADSGFRSATLSRLKALIL
jgi:hypothetical protein